MKKKSATALMRGSRECTISHFLSEIFLSAPVAPLGAHTNHARDGVWTAEIGDSTVCSHRSALAPTHARLCGPYGFARASSGVREERAILAAEEAKV